MIATILVAVMCLVNVGTVLAFAEDKRRAVAGAWRISEASLLMLALVGGSPGAYWARAHFRHKTRKEPFSTQLQVICTVQAGLIAGLTIAFITI